MKQHQVNPSTVPAGTPVKGAKNLAAQRAADQGEKALQEIDALLDQEQEQEKEEEQPYRRCCGCGC